MFKLCEICESVNYMNKNAYNMKEFLLPCHILWDAVEFLPFKPHKKIGLQLVYKSFVKMSSFASTVTYFQIHSAMLGNNHYCLPHFIFYSAGHQSQEPTESTKVLGIASSQTSTASLEQGKRSITTMHLKL